MSVKVSTWAWAQKLPAAEKLTLLALSDHCDDDGRSCFPSKRKLAEKTSISERNIRRIVTRLQKKGILRRSFRFSNGRQTSNNYHIGGGTTCPPGGVTLTLGGDTTAPPEGDTMSPPRGTPQPPHESSDESSEEPSGIPPGQTDAAKAVIKKINLQIDDFYKTLEKPNLSDKHRSQIKKQIQKLEEKLADLWGVPVLSIAKGAA